MKPFNLEEYLDNPSKKVVTRDGREARIICTDVKTSLYDKYKYTIVALVKFSNGAEEHYSFLPNGRFDSFRENALDLFFAQEKKEGWVNIYKDYQFDRIATEFIFDSKEHAENAGIGSENYITTIKIEWEE